MSSSENLTEYSISMEQKLDRLAVDFHEFTVFVKQQFERQEKILESMSNDIKDVKGRTGKIEETLYAVQQAFLFKAF